MCFYCKHVILLVKYFFILSNLVYPSCFSYLKTNITFSLLFIYGILLIHTNCGYLYLHINGGLIMQESNLDKIKNRAISLLLIEPEQVPSMPYLLIHPYFETSWVMLPGENKFVDILENREKYNILINHMKQKIKEATSVEQIFMYLRSQYRLTLFKYTNIYMSKEDFEKTLIQSWVMCENPSDDVNVTQAEKLRWFKKLNYISDLSGIVTIYRGVENEKWKKGLSWTLNKNKAIWFATRFSDEGIVYTAQINSSDILYYTSDRGEEEVIVDPKKLLQIQSELILKKDNF